MRAVRSQWHGSGDSRVRLYLAKSLDKAVNRAGERFPAIDFRSNAAKLGQASRLPPNGIYAIAVSGPLRCVVDKPWAGVLSPVPAEPEGFGSGTPPRLRQVTDRFDKRPGRARLFLSGFALARPGRASSLAGSDPAGNSALWPGSAQSIAARPSRAALGLPAGDIAAPMAWIAFLPFNQMAMIRSGTAASRGPPRPGSVRGRPS